MASEAHAVDGCSIFRLVPPERGGKPTISDLVGWFLFVCHKSLPPSEVLVVHSRTPDEQQTAIKAGKRHGGQ